MIQSSILPLHFLMPLRIPNMTGVSIQHHRKPITARSIMSHVASSWGGSSGINYMMYVYGSSWDYDNWGALVDDEGWPATSMQECMCKHQYLLKVQTEMLPVFLPAFRPLNSWTLRIYNRPLSWGMNTTEPLVRSKPALMSRICQLSSISPRHVRRLLALAKSQLMLWVAIILGFIIL